MIATRTVVVSSYSLDDRVAIVTGAGSGIGEATALLLAEQGLDVALVGRRRERLDALAAEIAGAGGRAFVVPADLAEARAPWAVVDAVVDVVHERLLAGLVALVHAVDLRHGHVGLIDHAEPVVGKVVEEGVRGLAGAAAVDVARVVLDAGTETHLAQHLEVVRGAHAQALGLE